MGSEIKDRSTSEISDATKHEKLVDEVSKQGLHDASSLTVPDVAHAKDYSDGSSNGQLDNHLNSDSGKEGSMHEAAKDGQIPTQSIAATDVILARVNIGTGDPISPSNLTSEDYDLNKILIDTTAPFESVKDAVSKFGGIVDWNLHKVQTVERREIIEQELKKVQQEIPRYKEQSEVTELSKTEILKDLESAKKLIEDLKLNLEKAQTEERQARQDAELTQLRVEEMEQGIAHEASVAAKTQLEVAKARHEAAISDLKTVKDELQTLRIEYSTLLAEKDAAEKKAEEAVSISKDVEKSVEELTIELISTKESLESSHAAHLEAEEHRIGKAVAKEEERLTWDKDLKQAEEDLAKLNNQIELKKDVSTKLDTASSLLADLKAELAGYMESKPIVQEINELEDVKVKIEKATEEVNCLRVGATSLKAELEKEKLELDNLRQRERVALMEVAALETELENIKSGMLVVEMREKEARERASQEAGEANSCVELAREELRKAKEEAEEAKAGASTVETRLNTALKEREAARESARLAMAAIKALQDSDPTHQSAKKEDTLNGVITLSLEKYYELSKRAQNAEKEANVKVAKVMSQIEVAKEDELRSLAQLEEANQEVENRKETLRIAMEKVERAKEGKMIVEQELRRLRAENEQQRDSIEGQDLKGVEGSSESSMYGHEFKIEKVIESAPSFSFGQGLGLKNIEEIANSSSSSSSQHGTTSESCPDESLVSPKGTFGQSNTVKKKRRSLFPRFFMFFTRRKPASKSS